MTYQYYVYVMTNKMNTTLYVGVTNNLERRALEHKSGEGSCFTKQYKLTKLIYFEETSDVRAAINREKELKGWSRRKKDNLIKTLNPLWDDLSKQFINPSSFRVPPSSFRVPPSSFRGVAEESHQLLNLFD